MVLDLLSLVLSFSIEEIPLYYGRKRQLSIYSSEEVYFASNHTLKQIICFLKLCCIHFKSLKVSTGNQLIEHLNSEHFEVYMFHYHTFTNFIVY